jgi:hypothetical protein
MSSGDFRTTNLNRDCFEARDTFFDNQMQAVIVQLRSLAKKKVITRIKFRHISAENVIAVA